MRLFLLVALSLVPLTAEAGRCYGLSFDGMCLTSLNEASAFALPSGHRFVDVAACRDADGVRTGGCVVLSTETDQATFTHRIHDGSVLTFTYGPTFAGYAADSRIRTTSSATVYGDELVTTSRTVVREPNGTGWRQTLILDTEVVMGLPWSLSTGQDLEWETVATAPNGTVLWTDVGGSYAIASGGGGVPSVAEYCGDIANHAGDTIQQAVSDAAAKAEEEGREAGAMYATGVGEAHKAGSASKAFIKCMGAPQKFAPAWYTAADAVDLEPSSSETADGECPPQIKAPIVYTDGSGLECTVMGTFECTPDCECTVIDVDMSTFECNR